MIDSIYEDCLYEDHKITHLQIVLAVIHLCQKLDRQEPNFESNILSKFEMQKTRLEVCIIPKQKDFASCSIIVVITLYQISI